MTEAEWLACEDPEGMIGFLANTVYFPNRTSKRKKRLFVIACCRRAYDSLNNAERQILAEAERLAEGEATPAEEEGSTSAYYGAYPGQAPSPGHEAVEAARAAGWGGGSAAAARAVASSLDEDCPRFLSERGEQARLLRDVFGPLPFREVPVPLAWRTPSVIALARAALDEWTFPIGELDTDRLAVLADALEDAGCADADLLGHLRGPGPHVRGCWALDLILGKP